jgi:hypothetical protein
MSLKTTKIKVFLHWGFLLFYLSVFIFPVQAQSGYKSGRFFFNPGKPWEDNENTPINAHGGGLLYYNGIYYWFGEYKTSGRLGNTAQVGVSCYSSGDLFQWKNEGIALKVQNNPESEIQKGSIIERPKVIYNTKTKKFVMWFHLELKGRGYAAARTAVAVADKPEGPYTYLRSYRPNAGVWPFQYPDAWKQKVAGEDTLKGWTDKWRKAISEGLLVRRDFTEGQMARDMTLFVDDDGKAYHVHSSEENLTLHISELSDDYLSFTGKWIQVFPGGHNEAPTLCKYNGKYYMITSGCTGWAPNAARSAVSHSIWGPWKSLGNPCIGKGDENTFQSQSTYILKVEGINNGFIFMADRWVPDNPVDGSYIWLPLLFENDKPVLQWYDQWNFSVFGK